MPGQRRLRGGRQDEGAPPKYIIAGHGVNESADPDVVFAVAALMKTNAAAARKKVGQLLEARVLGVEAPLEGDGMYVRPGFAEEAADNRCRLQLLMGRGDEDEQDEQASADDD